MTQRGSRAGLLALTALATCLLACGAPEARPEPAPRSSSPAGPSGLDERCGDRLPRDAEVAAVELAAAGGHLVAAAVTSPAHPSRTGVVLLPQIGSPGLCGWLPYAAELARRGAVALAVDPCGYGESDCPSDVAIAEQVTLAADHVRKTAGVTRVVVVGASMGGAQAVRAVAGGAEVDAWVDISGPSAWEGEWLLDLADRVRLPGMVVRAPDDGSSDELDRAVALARRVDATFVRAPSGHGWELVLDPSGRMTGIGRRVAAFALGDGPLT
ncbi:alpha/beta hydrolase [Nocardioides sp. 503]|uniref:alpha/beta hydrolase family protein n=1 Tax=Nocardioides sp. 503 TaxID=2508326 RepID=UPI00106FDE71|nr:alpha/beta hydrolase [Nocardioides sp. 503]